MTYSTLFGITFCVAEVDAAEVVHHGDHVVLVSASWVVYVIRGRVATDGLVVADGRGVEAANDASAPCRLAVHLVSRFLWEESGFMSDTAAGESAAAPNLGKRKL